MSPVRRPGRRALVLALAALLWSLAVPQLDGGQFGGAAAPYAGRPLAEALLELRELGLKIVFTSTIVLPAMTVEAEPTATEPRAILDQLLAPHGLIARGGPSGSLVVVDAGSAGAGEPLFIAGVVRARDGALPVAGAEVELVESGKQVRSTADGTFRLVAPGSGRFALEVRRRGYVIEHLEDVVVTHGVPTEVEILLDRAPVTEEELVVTPSHLSLLRAQPDMPLALSRGDILALPHLGDDFFRALSLLPGVTSNDVSAQFHVRGGRSDETQVLLDGQELYETYHLKDFDSALSVVAVNTLDSVDLSTGGFPVEHGDRMGGVLDMNTRTPTGPRRTHVGLSLLNIDLGGAGVFDDDRGRWLAQARRGAIDLASKLLGPERPQYWDAFGKLDYQLTAGQNLRFNVLYSHDELEFRDTQPDSTKSRATQYENSYLWLTHQASIGSDLLIESAVSRSRIDRDRRGVDVEDDAQFDITDRRDLDVSGLRQDWTWHVTENNYLKWGHGWRDFEVRFDYQGSYNFDNPLSRIRQNPGAVSTVFEGVFDASHNNIYIADRVTLGSRGALEIGVRYDEHSLTAERLLSPRANLAINLASRSVLRASWGRFTQSQRPYELQVEDGETEFNRVEIAEHQVLGFEHLFGAGGDARSTLRVEVYRRNIDNPLPRFENLYEPINSFPEVEPDRVMVAPLSSAAEGVEIFLRNRWRKVGWWANYTYSKSEDALDGEKLVRRFDQTHALNLDVDIPLGEKWTLNAAWRFHTGWPTTPLSVEEAIVLRPNEDGELEAEVEFVPVLGPRFSERLPNYHRLDVRASRSWRARSSAVKFFIDIQNAYGRRNVSGFDFQIDEDTGDLESNPETWAGMLPSVGISFEF